MGFGGEPPSAQFLSQKTPVLQAFLTACAPGAAPYCAGMLLLEESQPVASDDGWTQTITIEQIEQTPRGTRMCHGGSSIASLLFGVEGAMS